MLRGDKINLNRGPAVTWDVTGMVTLYGTVFGIEVSREEICLLLGARTVQTGRDEETIVVRDRIIVSPFTAKRLFLLLKKMMARHQLPFEMDARDLRAFMEASN